MSLANSIASATPVRCLLTFAALFLLAAPAMAAETPRIAIIIDDLGYNLAAGRRALALPGPVAYAILPETPRGPALAEVAHRDGKDVLLHLPLQAAQEESADEPGGLRLDMNRAEFEAMLARNLETVPYALGVNSHRGSLLTRHPGHMAWLMAGIRQHGDLLFVDSYTTHRSVALAAAREAGVPSVRRNVFLDPDKEPATVAREFERLKRVAVRDGFALGIGHPYPATLDFLERELPQLAADGFELVGIGQYVSLQNGAASHTAAAGGKQ